ncbi:MAG TPA: hypothetical protein DEA96_01025 [Leptospiraceae bacterium]|nr:hypothetical protein [Spirochaetaceae bacterium]HBS03515.1 hypothetical protein [Leptospiraceae bacterium]|tara:strand:- start:142 stop:729 length:588 start_codon:yes stop_codon:yes gene_type:complete
MLQKVVSLIAVVVSGILVAGCLGTGPIRGDLFADRFNAGQYVNHAAGFKLHLPPGWSAYTHFDDMPPDIKPLARDTRSYGSEIAMVAISRNQLMGMRVLMEDTDVPLQEYFRLIKEINQVDIANDMGYRVTRLGNVDSIRWIMDSVQDGVMVRYLEYQLHLNQFNVRITFWTPEKLYSTYSSHFEEIAGSFQRIY